MLLASAGAAPLYPERLQTTRRAWGRLACLRQVDTQLPVLQTLVLVVRGADISSGLARRLLSELRDLGPLDLPTLFVRGFAEEVEREMEVPAGKMTNLDVVFAA
ncbi:hypothetical protein AURDEDRAFT_116059 [Auricularia subglabra TFB-10046 SS5]|uniref:Uncharacterized protein n=1 Tax=Auricularia subglabra (strain TFB-10046 / SS5) TaxID=717982 RepID=J0WW80_AURST|nr:hypothetical protein AURDEDRAFT_116059 [Auricularia subglabra TFB-10046 SS5]